MRNSKTNLVTTINEACVKDYIKSLDENIKDVQKLLKTLIDEKQSLKKIKKQEEIDYGYVGSSNEFNHQLDDAMEMLWL